jgi:predicted HTH domain antitoxin
MSDLITQIFNSDNVSLSKSFAEFVIPLAINLLVTGVIIFGIYYRKMHRKEYMTTFSLISLTVFFLVFLLDSIELQIGLALGLFAVFGIIRYRTITIPIKEMTFLFVIIGISVINALANTKIGYTGLLLANGMIILACWLFESKLIKNHISVKEVRYDKVSLIKAGKYDELKADLEERLDIIIVKIETGAVDFIRDSAMLQISYQPKDTEVNVADAMENLKTFSDEP